jgi:hypothetical protein
MFRDGYKNAQVVTSDGKKLGTVKSLDSKSLVVFKKGLIKQVLQNLRGVKHRRFLMKSPISL